MSPEPVAEIMASNSFETVKEEIESTPTDTPSDMLAPTDSGEISYQTDCTVPRKQRERRNKSPIAISTLLETFAAPLSPASSTSTSQGNSSADATFEPSIDMMVNDFDDEQTLNEEEALAAAEQQDPNDEIATLQEESEMPLEELLAKYQVAPPVPVHIGAYRKKKRSAGGSKNSKQRKVASETAVTAEEHAAATLEAVEDNAQNTTERSTSDIILIEESGDEENTTKKVEPNMSDDNEECLEEEEFDCKPAETVENVETTKGLAENKEKNKHRRTHLMDLYPEESFTEVLNSEVVTEKDAQIDLLCEDDNEEDVNDAEEEEEDEFDSDYVKKTIMVGASYQATIPDGLSQYGDVLPYENEDKLIWEPSQVSERQVEEYLLKARDIKPSSLLDNGDEEGEESSQTTNAEDVALDPTNIATNGVDVENKELAPKNKADDVQSTVTALSVESADATAVIKDNEQALHLLVQCGYDFKEALRRKRLNALPLTGSMSLWSEEECHKFEEGIQKFGKDFYKIRQNQVRTRTMRELVQFYYIWKKSDRRDHNFANSDTVDHMDIYLNEGGDFSPTAAINGTSATAHSSNTNGSITLATRKNNAGVQKNPISIMMVGSTTTNNSAPTATASAQLNGNTSKVASNRKRNVENPINQNLPTTPVAQTK
ncbi:mesoderm induction early response protein 1 [Zeugodacus cucurbitae]|uniref:mesoderm induction early response protein 1 n=1 Tax=Zeugodacus cucurbitae TaxID=28588 RepID=UPI0005968C8F|nr:mesoderm induction early response protein 1 [Zeugodacus cucurbitae]